MAGYSERRGKSVDTDGRQRWTLCHSTLRNRPGGLADMLSRLLFIEDNRIVYFDFLGQASGFRNTGWTLGDLDKIGK